MYIKIPLSHVSVSRKNSGDLNERPINHFENILPPSHTYISLLHHNKKLISMYSWDTNLSNGCCLFLLVRPSPDCLFLLTENYWLHIYGATVR